MRTTKSLLSVLALSFFVLSAYAAGGSSSDSANQPSSASSSSSMGSSGAATNDTGTASSNTDVNGNPINRGYGSSATDKDQPVKHRPNTNAEDQNAPNTSGTPESNP